MKVLKWVGLIGFFACLIIMYTTNHGIRGLRKYDADFRLLDMRFHYTAANVNETFTKLNEGGRVAYRNYWILDFFFIACFLVVQLTIINSIAMGDATKNVLIVISVLRALLDIVENSMLLYLIGKYPIQNNQFATICSWVTTSKFIALFLWIIGITVMLLYPVVHRS